MDLDLDLDLDWFDDVDAQPPNRQLPRTRNGANMPPSRRQATSNGKSGTQQRTASPSRLPGQGEPWNSLLMPRRASRTATSATTITHNSELACTLHAHCHSRCHSRRTESAFSANTHVAFGFPSEVMPCRHGLPLVGRRTWLPLPIQPRPGHQ